MIQHQTSRFTGEPPKEDKPLADMVQRIRLAKLCHSDNDLAAAVATVGLLLLRQLDRETGVAV